MLPPGHSAGALTRESALALIEEVAAANDRTTRYLQAVEQLRRVLDDLHGND
jgi:hypothetical protein